MGMLLTLVAIGGCRPSTAPATATRPAGDLPPPSPAGQEPMKAVTAETPASRIGVLLIRLRVASIEVPVGTASNCEKMWSYLDEEPIGALRSASLGRNGVRIGLGRKQDWSDVARLLEDMTGRRLKETAILAVPGQPVPVAMKTQSPPQTIFTFHDDRTLRGGDYPAGDNLLTLSCTIDENHPTRIVVTGQPQIETTSRKIEFVQGPQGLMMMPKSQVFSFPEMAFSFTIESGNLFVVGPSTESRRLVSVGYNFLYRQKQGVEYETLLVVIPDVFYAPPKGTAPVDLPPMQAKR